VRCGAVGALLALGGSAKGDASETPRFTCITFLRYTSPTTSYLGASRSSPAAVCGPPRGRLWPPISTVLVSSRRARAAYRGAAPSARDIQVHNPRESPAAMTTQPLVSAANTVVAIGWA
jgi:hypothetical protein